ncbi:hypothetical protein ZWY2020_008498 [Hordeum vulgare]|nr:hypothetical protein ZWY2020_008498 [Hordeum vulgare]
MSSSSAAAVPGGTPADALRRNRILSSKLYFDVPGSKAPVVYSTAYDIAFLGIEKMHPFDSSKWGRICRFLTKEGHLEKNRVVEPLEASQEDLLVVHTEAYLNSLRSSFRVAAIVEVPPLTLIPNWLVQQRLLYLRKQLNLHLRGWAINVGGGFHHCSAEEGGGFWRTLIFRSAFSLRSVMIIDLDAHQGNGYEKDFANDGRVYILDMYNAGIYPFDYAAKRYIDQKIELVSGTETDDYLDQLDKALKVAQTRFQPQLIIYNAGTDILDGDPLGNLKIIPEGVVIRDEKVFKFAKDQNIPLVMMTSGGYMKSSARVIADSITNLSQKDLIQLGSQPN